MTELSVHEMRETFLSLAQKTFSQDRGGFFSKADVLELMPKILMFMKVWKSRYRSTNLRAGLIKLFGKDTSVFTNATTTRKQRVVRAAVTTTSSGQPCIFSNYSRAIFKRDQLEDDALGNSKDFEREDDPKKEAKIWEA